MPADTEDRPKLSLAPPAPKITTKAPAANEWPWRLRELLREWKLCFEDFGLTKQTMIRYAEQAKRGDKKAIGKIEPLRQFFLTLMGMTKHNRAVKYEEGELSGKVKTRQEGTKIVNNREVPNMVVETEERSVFGIREGHDLAVNEHARKPKPALIYLTVKEHFYDLCSVLEAVKPARQGKFHGRKHPSQDEFDRAHEALIGKGEPGKDVPELKAFAKKETLRKQMQDIIENTNDPLRRDVLEMLIPYIADGKETEWNGED